MKKILLHSRKTTDQEGRAIELAYFLLTEEEGGVAQYGVEIVLRRGSGEESARCQGVTPLAGKMETLIRILAEHTVTPVNLRQSLIDLL